jgi:hypothetical protein
MANFFYVPDTGVLTGPSFEAQTEAEFNSIRTNVTTIQTRLNKVIGGGAIL